jgi:uncharacterized protein with HEPN domain
VRRDRLRLLDALEQIEPIRKFAETGRETFFNDALIQSAILHRLALLGEACRGVSTELREANPEIPWNQIIAFRNIVIHQYFGIDLVPTASTREDDPNLARIWIFRSKFRTRCAYLFVKPD